MSYPYETATYEIELVCTYIKDDQTVANYFGVSRDRVASVRANMRVRADLRFTAERKTHENDSSGVNCHLVAANEAEVGSRRLNERIQALFRKWERIHGFQGGAAQVLLPAGYCPEKQMEAA